QGFATCSVPAVGAYVRELLSQMYAVLLEHTKATPEQARDYLARGLLVNTVLAMGFPEHLDEHPWASPLVAVMLGSDSTPRNAAPRHPNRNQEAASADRD
ncbi:MAG TPA: hypothetical protein VFM66_07800, partial [Agromyces sp.]|nr:hypothetical protein [Agromyces sp.]